MCVFALGREQEEEMVNVAVKEMEGVTALTDAIKKCFTISPRNPAAGPPAENRKDKRGRGGGLTRSRTKDSFARDWKDRLLSEYRFGCSEPGFEFGTSVVTTNLG